MAPHEPRPRRDLGEAGEGEWRRIRTALDFGRSFQLVVVAAQSRLELDELSARIEEGGAVVRVVATPQGLPRLLESIEQAGAKLPGAPAAGSEAEEPRWKAVWVDAWYRDEAEQAALTASLARLNERRDRIRRGLVANLVVAGPPGLVDLLRHDAPDLWSVRALVAHLPAAGAAPPAPERPQPIPAGSEEEAERLLGLAAGLEQRTDVSSVLLRAGLLVRAAGELRGARKLERASEVASAAVALVEPPLAEAEPAARRALSMALDERGAVRVELGDLDGAEQDLSRALELDEQAFSEGGESQEVLRDLGISLGRVGEMQLARGKPEGAEQSFRRSLEIFDRIVARDGETPQAERDLSVSLHLIGDAQLARGELEQAADSYARALEIRERILARHGESQEALRDLSVTLDDIGDLQLARGDLEGAEQAHARSLAISERILREYGESPQALRDVSISLDRIGDVLRFRGELERAAASYERSLDLSERILARYGETPEALRDLGVSLDRVGEVRRSRGDLEAAARADERAREVRERLARYGRPAGGGSGSG